MSGGPLLVIGGAVVGGVVGTLVPTVVRRLPVPDPADLAADETAPDYVAIAALPRLRLGAAVIGVVVFGLLGWLAPPIALPSAAVVAAAGLSLGYVDLREHLLPERILWPTAGIALLVLVVQAAVLSRWSGLLVALAAAVVAFGVFLLLALIARGGFGFGDVQLVTVLALTAGWVSMGTAVLAVVLAILAGGLLSAVLLLTRRIRRGQAVAFGPFLLVGWWAALLLTSVLAPVG